jgi:hypothetical protein
VIGARFQATPVRDSRDYFRCPEQLKLQAVLAGMDYTQVQAEMPEVWALAGVGQGARYSLPPSAHAPSASAWLSPHRGSSNRMLRHATYVPDEAVNRGHQRSTTGTENGQRPGQALTPVRQETTF